MIIVVSPVYIKIISTINLNSIAEKISTGRRKFEHTTECYLPALTVYSILTAAQAAPTKHLVQVVELSPSPKLLLTS